MIPNEQQAKALWGKYNLPESKRVHVACVAKVALFFARELAKHDQSVSIDEQLLVVSALLHDIDKNIPRRKGETHPDTAVRVLIAENMQEVAHIVKTHSLHAILDPAICPTTWEEKLLYLADKMVKQEIIGVDKRFDLWKSEHLPQQAKQMLKATYPKVKKLEHEVLGLLSMDIQDIKKLMA